MRERVADILRHDFKEIIGSPLILKLLDIYSKLYLNGGPAGFCETCHRTYYQELQKTGLIMAEKYEEIKNRTLVPKWNGLLWIPKAARHFSSENITDKEAIHALKTGQISESFFTTLPEGYKIKPDTIEKVGNQVDETPKKRGPKKK